MFVTIRLCILKNFTRIIILILLILFTSLIFHYNSKSEVNSIRSDRNDTVQYLMHKKYKYILQWPRRWSEPFEFMLQEDLAFVKNKCKFTNCYVTDDNMYFVDRSNFDAIVFNGWDVVHRWPFEIPKNRILKQKYIFGAMESADNYPACDEDLDGFFNWTWTYKLDSDFRWGYITVYDMNGTVVGPAVDVRWEREMKPISKKMEVKLSHKSKAAAWFVSHCSTKSRRENFVQEVTRELELYGLEIDIYGACGPFKCPLSKADLCFKNIEKDYYFYFALENSFAEDYVTEKLMIALKNYAIPVVYGAANYSRFLPPGSYLDGRALGPKELARQMYEIIGNKTLYHDFFRWRNYYVYKETARNEDICKLCEMLNDEEKMAQTSVWNDFRSWWNGAPFKYYCN